MVSKEVIQDADKEMNMERDFEQTQDSLRDSILNSKPNENLKSSILKELYIRGLVNPVDAKIRFKLPFDLHGFDCGAPDCYTTDITFEITEKKPIEFPKRIDFRVKEHGCGIEGEIIEHGVFELVEQSPTYVNYYSKNLRSNLIILNKKGGLYYFTDAKPDAIKVATLDKLLDTYDIDAANAIDVYRSTVMTTNEYGILLDNKA